MSISIKVIPFVVGVELTVPSEVIEANMGYHPGALGEFFARQVVAMEAEQHLGYYPAFDNYRPYGQPVEPELVILIDQVADFSRRYAEQELKRRLTREFTKVNVHHTQIMAYAMPRVLPSEKQAQRQLGEHFAPDTLRIELLIETTEAAMRRGIDDLIKDKFLPAIDSAFSHIHLLKAVQTQ